MNTSPYTVRCLHCSSVLPVNEVQMQQADGYVRCAKCQTVFYAPDHLLDVSDGHSEAQKKLLFDLSEEETRSLQPPTLPPSKSAPAAQPTPVRADEHSASHTPRKSLDNKKNQPRAGIEERSNDHKVPEEHKTDESPEVVTKSSEIRYTNNLNLQQRNAQKASKSSAHRWLWWLGIWALIISIAITWFVISFDSWSRKPLLRGVYTYACMWSSCDVPRDMAPVFMEVRAGQASLGPGVYRIQGAVRNSAFYPQPLPVIRLEFIDLQNKTHASRTFLQSEYAEDPETILKSGKVFPFTLEVELADPVQFHLVPKFVLVSY